MIIIVVILRYGKSATGEYFLNTSGTSKADGPETFGYC